MNFEEWLISDEFVGRGLNGFAFGSKNGNISKFTTSESEANIAKWLIKHPHKNIARIESVAKANGKWKIVMERVDTKFPSALKIEKYRKEAEKSGCKSPEKIADYLEQHYSKEPYVAGVISAIRHVLGYGRTLTDFCNPNNMGIKNGQVVLFDFN